MRTGTPTRPPTPTALRAARTRDATGSPRRPGSWAHSRGTVRGVPVISGIVLAAGAGVRHGGPKALVPGWLDAATRLLLDSGCDRVVVVLGAGAAEARTGLRPDRRIEVRTASDWADGMGASLREGLLHATGD